jgi:hypothetical protein
VVPRRLSNSKVLKWHLEGAFIIFVQVLVMALITISGFGVSLTFDSSDDLKSVIASAVWTGFETAEALDALSFEAEETVRDVIAHRYCRLFPDLCD